MTDTSFKHHFRRFFQASSERLHLAAHSHHPWPDVSREAHIQAWDDAARLVDHKWEHIFATVWPQAQRHVAILLGLSDPASVVFSSNTLDFLLRVVSALPPETGTSGKPLRVLSTDAEFHSFTRQMSRLEEDGLAVVERVPAEPLSSLASRLAGAAADGGHDLVFFSHVLFNSGAVVEPLAAIVAAVPDDRTLIMIDGYHAAAALPVDLSQIENRAFYMAGGYKYAMSGEGVCFLHCPPGYAPRPRNTGWYAAFGALEAPADGAVGYGKDASRFMGSTFDQTALYRFNAVMDLWEREGLDVGRRHAHVVAVRDAFADAMDACGIDDLARHRLTPPAGCRRGHFLTYETPRAGVLCRKLAEAGIVTDHRDTRLRFGFGLYHDRADVPLMAHRVASALK